MESKLACSSAVVVLRLRPFIVQKLKKLDKMKRVQLLNIGYFGQTCLQSRRVQATPTFALAPK